MHSKQQQSNDDSAVRKMMKMRIFIIIYNLQGCRTPLITTGKSFINETIGALQYATLVRPR